MKEQDIRDAYCRIRTIDHTIPDDVLDFMFKASLEKWKEIEGYRDERARGQNENFGILYGLKAPK